MSDLLKDQEQLTDALQTVQRLYMKFKNKKECVSFYTKHIQPIYAEFEANVDNKQPDTKALPLHSVVFSETECKHKDSCGHDLCNLTECDEFEEKVSEAEVRCETCKYADGWKCNHQQGICPESGYKYWEQRT